MPAKRSRSREAPATSPQRSQPTKSPARASSTVDKAVLARVAKAAAAGKATVSAADWRHAATVGADAALQAVVDKKKRGGETLTSLSKAVVDIEFTPEYIASASAADVAKALETVVAWKLHRGSFRPGLLQQVQRNAAKDVVKAFRAAFTALASPAGFKLYTSTPTGVTLVDAAKGPVKDAVAVHDPEALLAAVGALSALGGVGPATASAVLARSSVTIDGAGFAQQAKHVRVCGRHVCPFMADEAIAGLGLPLKYDVSTCRKFLAAAHEVAVPALCEDAELTMAGIASGVWAANVLK